MVDLSDLSSSFSKAIKHCWSLLWASLCNIHYLHTVYSSDQRFSPNLSSWYSPVAKVKQTFVLKSRACATSRATMWAARRSPDILYCSCSCFHPSLVPPAPTPLTPLQLHLSILLISDAITAVAVSYETSKARLPCNRDLDIHYSKLLFLCL